MNKDWSDSHTKHSMIPLSWLTTGVSEVGAALSEVTIDQSLNRELLSLAVVQELRYVQTGLLRGQWFFSLSTVSVTHIHQVGDVVFVDNLKLTWQVWRMEHMAPTESIIDQRYISRCWDFINICDSENWKIDTNYWLWFSLYSVMSALNCSIPSATHSKVNPDTPSPSSVIWGPILCVSAIRPPIFVLSLHEQFPLW